MICVTRSELKIRIARLILNIRQPHFVVSTRAHIPRRSPLSARLTVPRAPHVQVSLAHLEASLVLVIIAGYAPPLMITTELSAWANCRTAGPVPILRAFCGC